MKEKIKLGDLGKIVATQATCWLFKPDNYFNSWKINNEIIIYKRIRNQFNIIEEELFITSEKYDEKMNRINARIEKGEIKR